MQDGKPLYLQILEELQRKIKDGVYGDNDKLPTEIELAQQYGVSRITSKRALIELEKQGLVYRKRGSGSYVRNQEDAAGTARDVNAARSRIISMILPWSSTGRLDYIQGANDYLDPRGYFLSIHISGWSVEKEKELLLKMYHNGHSGIILYPSSSSHNIATVNTLMMNDFPIVLIDQHYEGVEISNVVSDNKAGGYMAAEQLIRKGHTRIAFVTSIAIDLRSTIRERFLGYCKAHKDNRLPIQLDHIVSEVYQGIRDEDRINRLASLVKELVLRNVTAIQAEHDDMAIDLLKACQQAGIQVPEQLSIVGFDNEENAGYAQVPLTTVGQNYYEIGQNAAKIIVDIIEKKNTGFRPVVVPVQWVERNSVISMEKE
ncbi:GntR family transcriptional regulator [Cohnella sp. CFH 77786]|uniref:GntR family transcriptional regulator n=1 Tax=Cohnella sp. CFH 77786 TaxID=2662265 RepID=UPI001C60ED01|nr:GntR family transcriptional regulator [Cohnella sp. CFH 77786]MBW5447553.1 GntR family transcriptional regulator [Cohnella sp. CFH 77786]